MDVQKQGTHILNASERVLNQYHVSQVLKDGYDFSNNVRSNWWGNWDARKRWQHQGTFVEKWVSRNCDRLGNVQPVAWVGLGKPSGLAMTIQLQAVLKSQVW